MLHDSEAGTRLDRILEAAQVCLARDGYAHVSVKDIASEARVAPGLLHYYFESKEQLLLAVVRQAAGRYRDQFFQQLAKGGHGVSAITASIEWAERKLKEDPTWFLLLFELYNLSLRDDRIRPELLRLLQEERFLVAEAVTGLLSAEPEHLGISKELLGSLVLAIFDGVIIHAMIDPSIKPAEHLALVARAIAALRPADDSN